MKDFAQQFIATVKKERITPLPRWIFIVRRFSLWTLGAIAIAGCATAVATILHLLRTNDWDVYEELADSLSGFVITTIPYAWLVILALMLGIAYLVFTRTPHGYRYRLAAITGSGLVISSLLGSVMYAAGIGERVDEYVRCEAPVVHAILSPHAKTWQQPEKGQLAGDVIASTSSSLSVKDERGIVWTVETAEATTASEVTAARLPNRVRLLGSISGSTTFKARRVLGDPVVKKPALKKNISAKKEPKQPVQEKPRQRDEKPDKEKGGKKTDETPTTSQKNIVIPASPAKTTSTTRVRLKRHSWREEIKDIIQRNSSR